MRIPHCDSKKFMIPSIIRLHILSFLETSALQVTIENMSYKRICWKFIKKEFFWPFKTFCCTRCCCFWRDSWWRLHSFFVHSKYSIENWKFHNESDWLAIFASNQLITVRYLISFRRLLARDNDHIHRTSKSRNSHVQPQHCSNFQLIFKLQTDQLTSESLSSSVWPRRVKW